MAYTLPVLPYSYDALEPHIDLQTMEIHHTKHHAGYMNKLNDAVKNTAFEKTPLSVLLGDLESIPESIRTTVRNNGGGYSNHKLFWEILSPKNSGEPSGELAKAINKSFGNFTAFKEKFTAAATSHFGSGWAWLVVKDSSYLEIYSTANQDSPYMTDDIPILGLDVWEHAYYLKYQNRRPEYVAAFWKIVNWERVAANFTNAKKDMDMTSY